MPLDRNAVDRTFRQHLKHLTDCGTKVSDKQKREMRKLHERMAQKVAANARRKG